MVSSGSSDLPPGPFTDPDRGNPSTRPAVGRVPSSAASKEAAPDETLSPEPSAYSARETALSETLADTPSAHSLKEAALSETLVSLAGQGPGIAGTAQQTSETLAGDLDAEHAGIAVRVSLGAAAFPVQGWARYEFIKLLGQGGMGSVYQARDRQLSRIVALKFIRGGDPNLVMRFLQEARAQARLEHPGICKVCEVGEVAGKAYIAMQYVAGQSLGDTAPQLGYFLVCRSWPEGAACACHTSWPASLIHVSRTVRRAARQTHYRAEVPMAWCRLVAVPFLSLMISAGCGGSADLGPAGEGGSAEALFAAAARCGSPAKSLIRNGSFSADLSDWTVEIHDPPSAMISAVVEGTVNKVSRVRNSKIQDFYKVQFWQPVASVTRDHCYHLCFQAKASAPRKIAAQMNKNAAPWNSYGLWFTPEVTTVWRKFETEFWATDTAADARLSFLFGDDTAAAYIDDIVLIDKGDIDTCAVP